MMTSKTKSTTKSHAISKLLLARRGLFPRAEAKIAAAKMISLIERNFRPNPSIIRDLEAVEAKLTDIADAYLIGLENANAVRWADSRKEMEALLVTAHALAKKLKSSSVALRFFLNTDSVLGIHHNASVAPLSRLENDLDRIIERANAVVTGKLHADAPPLPDGLPPTPLDLHRLSKSGPIETKYIRRHAVKQVARLLTEYTGDEIAGTFTFAKGAEAKNEFAQKTPQLVLNILQELDVDIDAAVVRTALRDFVKENKAQNR